MPTEFDPAVIQERLGVSDRFRKFMERCEIPPTPSEPPLPDDETADAILQRLGVQPEHREACLRGRPNPDDHPELWYVLRHAYHDLIAKMVRNPANEGYMGWPSLPDNLGNPGSQMFVWTLLAAFPDTRRYHAERGIPDDVSWTTLAALGQDINAANGGILWTWMLPLIFRGVSYRLGRHMFDRGGNGLNVHVPSGGGRLDPGASQASFDWAREFFPRHFPEEPIATFGCHSWLLDDQWAEYLPATSNIVQFQRRFQLDPIDVSPETEMTEGDADVLQFIFDRSPVDRQIPEALLTSLPQDTTLQRAFVTHLRSGRHWQTRNGSFAF